MTRSLSMARFKAHLSEVVGEVQHTRARIVIEKHGKPVAMLVPVAGQQPEGLLGLVGAFGDAPELAGSIDAAVRARRSDRPRKLPRLK